MRHGPMCGSRTVSRVLLVAAMLTCVSAAYASPNDTRWIGTQGDWFDPANWSSGVPSSELYAAWINNGGTAVVSSGSAVADYIELGQPQGVGGMLQTGGQVSVYSDVILGTGSSGDWGSYTISGGTLSTRVMDLAGGELNITNNAANVLVDNRLWAADGSRIEAVPGTTIAAGIVQIYCFKPQEPNFADLANIKFIVTATYEVGGKDLGPVEAGFEKNFALRAFEVGSGTVHLYDYCDTQLDGWDIPEALYVDSLIFPPNSRLRLGGVNVYYHHLQMDPTATIDYSRGGAIMFVPEPATLSLLALGGLLALGRRKRA